MVARSAPVCVSLHALSHIVEACDYCFPMNLCWLCLFCFSYMLCLFVRLLLTRSVRKRPRVVLCHMVLSPPSLAHMVCLLRTFLHTLAPTYEIVSIPNNTPTQKLSMWSVSVLCRCLVSLSFFVDNSIKTDTNKYESTQTASKLCCMSLS